MADDENFDPMPLLQQACERLFREMEYSAAKLSWASRVSFEDGQMVSRPIPPETLYYYPQPVEPGPNEVPHPIYWDYSPR